MTRCRNRAGSSPQAPARCPAASPAAATPATAASTGILPVDVYLPGCPPNPAAIIEALLMFLEPRTAAREGRTHWPMICWQPLRCCGLPPAVLALTGRWLGWCGYCSALGSLAGIVAAIGSLPDGRRRPRSRCAWPMRNQPSDDAGLLVADGLRPGPGLLACLLGTPAQSGRAGGYSARLAA